jgi:hypothetical protein
MLGEQLTTALHVRLCSDGCHGLTVDLCHGSVHGAAGLKGIMPWRVASACMCAGEVHAYTGLTAADSAAAFESIVTAPATKSELRDVCGYVTCPTTRKQEHIQVKGCI